MHVGCGLLYLQRRTFVGAFFTLISKKVKRLATQDRNEYWTAEAENPDEMWQEGRAEGLFTMARIYRAKR